MNNIIILILFVGWALVWSWVAVAFSKSLDKTTNLHPIACVIITVITIISTTFTWVGVKDMDLVELLKVCMSVLVMFGITCGCVKLIQKLYNNR